MQRKAYQFRVSVIQGGWDVVCAAIKRCHEVSSRTAVLAIPSGANSRDERRDPPFGTREMLAEGYALSPEL